MKISVGPTFRNPTDSWPRLRAMAEQADAGPYHSFATLDRLAYDLYEPMALLAAVAATGVREMEATALFVSRAGSVGPPSV